MYLPFAGKALIIINPQESAKTWPKSGKNHELLSPSNLESPHLLLTFLYFFPKKDDLANYSLINLTSKFGKILKRIKKVMK